MTESPLMDSGLVFLVFSLRDDPIACLNKAMAFLTVVASSRFPSTNNQLKTSLNPRNQATIQDGRGHGATSSGMTRQGLLNATIVKIEDLDTYDSDCDDILNAKAVLMANISNYASDVISKVPHSETYLNDMENQKTLILEEVSRLKMAEKDKDPEAIKRKFSNKPIDYVKLNKIYEDFGKHFVGQQELSGDEAVWYHMLNPSTKSFVELPVKIEVPKELPKTTPNARTEGEWGFKHTKAVFNNEIISFLKSLKDIFNVFDRDLLNEIMKVQTVFDQMDAVVQQSSVGKQRLEIPKIELLLEIDRLLQQIMSQDIILTTMIPMSLISGSVNVEGKQNDSCDKCFNLEAELLKLQNAHNDLLKRCSQLKNINFFENNDLKAELQDKDTTIFEQAKVKQLLDNVLDFSCKHAQRIHELLVYVQDTCPNAIKPSAEKVAVTPKNNVKKVRFSEHLISSSNIKQVESSKTSDSNTHVLSPTELKCSTTNCGSKPLGNKKNNRISQTPGRNMKNKVEAQPRNVNSLNRVVEPIHNVDVKHSLLKANSEPICATCKKSTFDGVHDMCLLDFVTKYE
uniref:Integrase, catalytic region, zinc finger, CCHC-type, peptidase aspartic, catalytic n=1 Tax=Tanacetum cinerariifolium TaxID=118510 RepID=A0A699HBM4_TANCI|nr:hypothetical protein [Tanacetum cinerariifolium]